MSQIINRRRAISSLRKDMSECRRCQFVDHSLIFPGKYTENMKYFFVGASPFNKEGEEEAFRTGRASANFDEFLSVSGIDREECYVTNSVVHVPINMDGSSRAQNDGELRNCNNYLLEQMKIMQPNLVVALGSVALAALNLIKPHPLLVKRNVGKGYHWFNNKYIFVLTHPSPNSFMMRPRLEQYKDYRALKQFRESLEEKNVITK